MKTKLTTLLFGLLLAVGWTSSAQAQELARCQSVTKAAQETIGHPGVFGNTSNVMKQGQQFSAPQRSQNFSQTSPVTHPKSWYQALPNVTWDGGSKNITEPFTDVDGMMALVKRVYTDKTLPGFKFSEPVGVDIPYQTIEYGWNINGTLYLDDIMIEASANIAINAIYFYDANGSPLGNWNANQSGTTFPSSWTTTGGVTNHNGAPSLNTANGYMGMLTIPASYVQNLNNTTGYLNIRVFARNWRGNSYVSNSYLYVYTESFPGFFTQFRPSYSTTNSTSDTYRHDHYLPGTVEAPVDPGYTVMLVKLNDNFSGGVPEYTNTTADLRNYFQTYIKELQLLTDGLRVNEGEPNAGTLFAYTGDLNRFYFIGKGKMAFGKSLYNYPFDRAPFYSMYEEFSPDNAGSSDNQTDFYEKMRQGVTYDVRHDCEGVIYLGHYFSMAGKEGTTENRVNSLVLYIPDNRGDEDGDDWQTYELEHRPTVGMYMIDLYADIEPSATQTDYYTVTVDWYDNLDVITHSEGIPQTYTLYQIMDEDNDGDMDTTVVYVGPNTTWSFDYPVGDPSAYDIYYYVIGTPTQATNQDTFFAKSNTDDVTVPGNSDFIGLQWWRYESDYVTNDGTNQEVNYYRNFLAPHALAVQGEAGINAGNVGTAGRTLTLYRDETPIIDLELVMNGNKAYYRIKYRNRNENQQVEPGYDPNTGELLNTNN